jgi:hypothetical protein
MSVAPIVRNVNTGTFGEAFHRQICTDAVDELAPSEAVRSIGAAVLGSCSPCPSAAGLLPHLRRVCAQRDALNRGLLGGLRKSKIRADLAGDIGAVTPPGGHRTARTLGIRGDNDCGAVGDDLRELLADITRVEAHTDDGVSALGAGVLDEPLERVPPRLLHDIRVLLDLSGFERTDGARYALRDADTADG